EAAGARERVVAADERGQGQERLPDVGGRRELADEPRERGGVLAGERPLELPRARAVPLDLVEEAAQELRMADVELEALEPEGPQPLHGHRDHLGVSLRLLEPDELDAGLVELAVAPDLRLVVAEDVREVGEADRPRLVPEPGGDDARDLGRRDVAPGARGQGAPARAGGCSSGAGWPSRAGTRSR